MDCSVMMARSRCQRLSSLPVVNSLSPSHLSRELNYYPSQGRPTSFQSFVLAPVRLPPRPLRDLLPLPSPLSRPDEVFSVRQGCRRHHRGRSGPDHPEMMAAPGGRLQRNTLSFWFLIG